jgi:primosomal protein N' (replication factor Y)
MTPRQPSLFDDDPPVQEPRPAEAPRKAAPARPPVGFCEVVVEAGTRALDRPLTYSIPQRLAGKLHPGSYVRVPLGRQSVCGYVVGFTDTPPQVTIRPVQEKILDEDVLEPQTLALAQWLSSHYRAPLAAALRCFLPPGSGRKVERVVALTDAGREAEESLLVPAQAAVLRALRGVPRLTWAQLQRAVPEDHRKALTRSLQALCSRGLTTDERRLAAPAAQARVVQVATLAGDRDWDALMAQMAARKPRQAEVIAALLAAEDHTLPLAALARPSVQALARDGLVSVAQQRVARTPGGWALAQRDHKLILNPAQEACLEAVREALQRHEPAGFLMHGVTGSGKTEVYLRTIEAALQMGRSAIVLVPEISLTPQAVGRFRARFGDRLALLHSALGAGQRLDEWERVRRGEATIVVGARSAIFAPCANLGIIVVDEEHESAYKQDADPRYWAHAVARQRAQQEGAVLLFGSATPLLETYHAATEGAEEGLPFRLLELPERVDSRPLPPVEVVDLRQEPRDPVHDSLSVPLIEAVRACVAAGEQAILFLNRRGFSTFVLCRDCGFSMRCPDCAVSLTYHHATRRLRCHHCDYDVRVPEQCPNCQGYDIGFHGQGTERVADQVQRFVEGAVVSRLDRDTTTRRGALTDILGAFAEGRSNVLVGTQMIAKGHDFPNVTLVGVLNADTGLNRPDFRAAERTFEVLTQVSGRAGRADKPGRVIVQTYNPDHYAIVAAAGHDYAAFCQQELASRRTNGYPPFTSLIRLCFADEEEERALSVARRCAVALQEIGVRYKRGIVQFLGPAEAPLHKLRGQFRYHLLLKGPAAETTREALEAALEGLGDTAPTVVTLDVDPMDMM